MFHTESLNNRMCPLIMFYIFYKKKPFIQKHQNNWTLEIRTIGSISCELSYIIYTNCIIQTGLNILFIIRATRRIHFSKSRFENDVKIT